MEAAQKGKHEAQQTAEKRRGDEERQDRLDRLLSERYRYERDIFSRNRRCRRLTADIAKLQKIHDKEVELEKARRSWWALPFESYLRGDRRTKTTSRNGEAAKRSWEEHQGEMSCRNKEEARIKKWADFLQNNEV